MNIKARLDRIEQQQAPEQKHAGAREQLAALLRSMRDRGAAAEDEGGTDDDQHKGEA